ncbi:hypothetical protein VC83_09360 [Pseudogymnoascus destructans]|uniref:Uncharacterized protein n=1 Tax=Pseudogymnoascus destructans TaxID=655981 RepID=A0A176ZYA7_9PEZI|nr:uncharacterized protein VC83_09360 [Pseudogymnoascus destructans]OAF54290.1 hypothetical protein VC83_09360 [Pseudogymnoascus destructans]
MAGMTITSTTASTNIVATATSISTVLRLSAVLSLLKSYPRYLSLWLDKTGTLTMGKMTLDGSIGDFQPVVGLGINALVEPASVSRTRYRVLIGSVRFLRSHDSHHSLGRHQRPRHHLL